MKYGENRPHFKIDGITLLLAGLFFCPLFEGQELFNGFYGYCQLLMGET
jgi:hypothetical protein